MQKHEKKLARTSIISSIVAIIAIITWLVKGVGGYIRANNQIIENAEWIKENAPIINKIISDIEVIKNDTTWIKTYLKTNQ